MAKRGALARAAMVVAGLALLAQGAAAQGAGERAVPALDSAAPGAGAKTLVFANTAIELYGHLDLSLDVASKGIDGRSIASADASNPAQGSPYAATGLLGWLPDISSNLSFFGIRGSRPATDEANVVFQIETQVDVAATPGTADNNASADNAVKGAFSSRNSFVGFQSASWGAVKIGKNDTPYKSSTARMDSLGQTVGDYNAIMGNTGGDNRAEFDQRFSHAIWYEAPKLANFNFSLMYSPGQNRASDNGNIAAAEPSCTGGNNPVGGGKACGDGSYGDAWSASVAYESGPYLGILAAELHGSVNRQADEIPLGGGAPAGTVGNADEWGFKGGAQFELPTRTGVSLIFEDLVRNANSSYNERNRIGWYAAAEQKLADGHQLTLAWAHAGNTPGDPGDPGVVGPDGTTSGGPKANAADLVALGYKKALADRHTTLYAVYATMVNQDGAHYDLGSSGHGVMTDCHDASPGAGGFSGGGGICFTGNRIQAFSVGMTHDF
jgi:predicted porin